MGRGDKSLQSSQEGINSGCSQVCLIHNRNTVFMHSCWSCLEKDHLSCFFFGYSKEFLLIVAKFLTFYRNTPCPILSIIMETQELKIVPYLSKTDKNIFTKKTLFVPECNVHCSFISNSQKTKQNNKKQTKKQKNSPTQIPMNRRTDKQVVAYSPVKRNEPLMQANGMSESQKRSSE